jgi:uncharacterized membrane protein YfcA
MANESLPSEARCDGTGLADSEQNLTSVFATGAGIGTLGGLIGLGGAEFRLPVLIGLFGFGPLEAVILNKAMSLVVVASALPFRAANVPWSDVAAHWWVIVNLLLGSLTGAWFGAGLATRLRSQALYRVIASMLVIIAFVLFIGHDPQRGVSPSWRAPPRLSPESSPVLQSEWLPHFSASQEENC